MKYTDIEYKKIKAEVEMAWYIYFGNEEEKWIPKLDCTLDKNKKIIRMPECLVKAKELY